MHDKIITSENYYQLCRHGQLLYATLINEVTQ